VDGSNESGESTGNGPGPSVDGKTEFQKLKEQHGE
jgi:hypothetical protein